MKALLALSVAVFGVGGALAEQVEVRGRVVCMLETNGPPRANHEHVLGFKTDQGKSYKLARTRFSEALFVDQRLHEKELLLKGSLNTQTLEPLKIQSVKNGVVHDLFYYCHICAIEAVTPEICVCCQEPVELTERPLTK